MNLLFVVLHLPEKELGSSSGLYVDLIKEWAKRGHNITVIGSSLEKSRLSIEDGIKVIRVKAGKIVGENNLIRKGVNMATLSYKYLFAYKKYKKKIGEFDWIVLPTPPITLIDFISKIKQQNTKLYLILRDIHPQSSASLGEIKYKWMYDFLYKRSQKGYMLSDIIGCMSPRNIEYIMKEHPNLEESKMRVLYNWLKYPTFQPCVDIRNRYNLDGKYIVLFGGNIALGQRIENIIDLACHYAENPKIRFVIIGKGVKKKELMDMAKSQGLKNILFLNYMPQEEYLSFVQNVDLGLISINENNAAPTCPSKIVSYMALGIPTLALINSNNDYGEIIEKAGAGYWAVGSDKEKVYTLFDELYNNSTLRKEMGKNGFEFYKKYLTVEEAYLSMFDHMK